MGRGKSTGDRHVLEYMLLVVILGMTVLFARMGPHRIVILNLFFVPIILAGFYLGRKSAGVLALFCALAVTIATALLPSLIAAYNTPTMVGLVLVIWASVLGLAAVLVGTLCDQRARTLRELHQAYIGVVEMLAKYLQGANPRAKARTARVAELSELVAQDLKLSRKEIDDIRVAALLYDLGNVPITTQAISEAIGALDASADKPSFAAPGQVDTLGGVLEGALPLLANQGNSTCNNSAKTDRGATAEAPVGARIIRAVRDFDDLSNEANGNSSRSAQEALRTLRSDTSGQYDSYVINAIERVARKVTHSEAIAAALA